MAEDTKPTGGESGVKLTFESIGEVVIEVGDDRCRNILWPMTRDLLRGKWTRNILIGVHAHASLQAMPDIPGIRIAINTRTRIVRIYDPLSLEESAKLLREINRQYKGFNGIEGRPEDEKRYEDQNSTDLKSNLFWMRRLVDSKQAEIISGRLPSLKEIMSLPGKTLVGAMSNSQDEPRHLEDRGSKKREDLATV